MAEGHCEEEGGVARSNLSPSKKERDDTVQVTQSSYPCTTNWKTNEIPMKRHENAMNLLNDPMKVASWAFHGVFSIP